MGTPRAVAVLLAALLIPVGALAQQAFPVKPVRVMIPYAAGGPNDIAFRMIGNELEPVWGQPLVVENRPGGGGRIAFEALARAAPDGYTLANVVSSLTTMPYLFKELNFDPRKDIVGIVTILKHTPHIVISDSLPAKNLQEFVAYARANPGRINYGAQGYGNFTHLSLALFTSVYGLNAVAIQYPGTPQMVEAGIRGDLQLMQLADLQLAQAKGKFRVIAVITDERLSTHPEAPTLKETGLFPFVPYSWIGLGAPAGTPRAVVDKIATDILAVFKKPDFTPKILAASGASSTNLLGPDEFAQLLRTEFKNWGELVARVGIQPQ